MAQTTRSEQPNSSAETPISGKPSILGGLKNVLAPRPTAARASTTGARPKGGTMRFFFGMLILMVGAQVLYYVEAVAFAKLSPGAASAHLWPANTPILGGLTPYLLVYFLLIGALWYGLYRFNIIPRDPFGVKAQAAAKASAPTATGTAGVRKTRADRRHASVAASTSTTKGNAKTAGTPHVAPAVASASVKTGIPGAHDKAYQQARAAKKTHKRRDVKR